MSDTEKPSGKTAPLPWIVLSGFLGIFAVGTPALNNATAPKSKETEKKEPAADPTPFRMSGKNPLKPVYDFYATHDGTWDPEEDLRKSLHNYEVEFLIATVPDPIDTPHGYAFDQVIDAIQRAVQKKDGYILDRCWLPWELDKKPRANLKPEEEAVHLRESTPGVMVFRHAKYVAKKINRPGLCIVFLVGETPIGGMHKRAFTKALRMMADAGHPVTEPVRILGPYFSGSQTSLQFIMGDWWSRADGWFRHNPDFRFDAISGNASALRKKDFFELDPYTDGHPRWQSDKFTLSSTVVPTKMVVSALLRYLARRDGCQSNEAVTNKVENLPGKVAILAESNTGFGKMLASIGKEDKTLLLRFPLHISRVKTEYTQAFHKQDQQNGLKQTDLLVPATIDDTNQSYEGVPSQGGATTTAVNAQNLSNILSTIAREHCRYVGVVASDTRDKLFLVRLIREYCPDVHIFLTDADQLLLHPEYRYYMRGVIVGSTYPLQAQIQNWVDPTAMERSLFATVGAQGYYNATLMHLGKHKDLLEYAPPEFAACKNTTNEGSVSLRRPPIWISVVSPTGSMIPLQVFTEYEDPDHIVRLNPIAHVFHGRQSLTYPGAMLPIGIALLAFWLYLIYQALIARSSRMFWEPATATGEFSLPQLCYRNLLLGSQAVLAIPVLAIVTTHAHANDCRSPWMSIQVGLMIFVLAGFLVGMFKPLCWPPSRLRQFTQWLRPRKLSAGRLELWSWAAINVALVAVIAGFAFLFLSRFWIYGGETRRTLFFIRAVDLTTGLTPLTPLFFLSMSFLAWAFFQLKRADQADRYSVPPPFPAGAGESASDGAFNRINELDRSVQEEIQHENSALRHPKAVALGLLLLLALGLGVWMNSLPTIEGWSWDGLFFTGFWVMFALSVATLIRLYYLWRRAKKVLDAISLVPMMRAFARLPVKITDVFGKYLFTQRPRLEHLQVPLHQLRLLAEATRSMADLPPELSDTGRIADALENRLREGLDPAAERITAARAERDLRGKLSAVAASCLTALAPRWKSLSVEDAYGEGEKAKEDKRKTAEPASEPAWVPLAENVVAAQIIIYVSQFFLQVRGLVITAMVCTSLLLLSATSYPFHPEHLLLVCLIGLSGAGLFAVIYVLIEMNRDEVVSRILKTTPGKFSLDSGVFGSFLTYVVPTVGVLAAQLSGSFRWLLDPLLHVLK